MEAMVLIGFVGTIVTLIDFGAKTISKSWRLYNEGVEGAAFEEMAGNLNQGIEFLKAQQLLISGTIDGSLCDLSDRVTAVSCELREVLRSCVIPKGGLHRGRHLKAAFKNIYRKDKFDKLGERLQLLSMQAQTHFSILHIEQNQKQLEAVHQNHDELKRMMCQHASDNKALVGQGYRRPKDYGYEWEQGEYVMVDDGLGALFPFPIYLCSGVDTFLRVMHIKFSSRGLPGLYQVSHGHIEILDSTNLRSISADDWEQKITPGKVLQLAFVMGRISALPKMKCPRCFKPYREAMRNSSWRECRSCHLSLLLVPPDTYAYTPQDMNINLGPGVYRDHRTGKSSSLSDPSNSHRSPSASTSRDERPEKRPRKPQKDLKGSVDIDLVCRRMILKWEPGVNVVFRYARCRCIVRLGTPSSYYAAPKEITFPVDAICPRHNTQGVSFKDYGDFFDNSKDPYFLRFGGYNCFRALLAESTPFYADVLGSDFISVHEKETALENLKRLPVQELLGVKKAWVEYADQVNDIMRRNGVPVPEDLDEKVAAVKEEYTKQAEQEKQGHHQVWKFDLDGMDGDGVARLREALGVNEVNEILNGSWDGKFHWDVYED